FLIQQNTAYKIKTLLEFRRVLFRSEPALLAHQPFVLITPTYGGGNGHGAVPKQVIKFLNDERNRKHIRGVIGAGNTNFGQAYCLDRKREEKGKQVAYVER